MIVAIDGPAGAGKSTVARLLAKRLGFRLLDTGAIYRSLALWAKWKGISYHDEVQLSELAQQLPFRFQYEQGTETVLLQEQDVTKDIRLPEISYGASRVSQYALVRESLLPLQRKLAQECSCVVEGRDIGTVVLPNASCKFFLTANSKVRAQRRFQELIEKGLHVTLEQILDEQEDRDERDANRLAAPLKKAEDAIFLDTSLLSLEQVVNQMEAFCQLQIHSRDALSKERT